MAEDWRNTPESAPNLKTRAQLQEELDLDYGMGRITREEWSNRFDRLSDPEWEVKRMASMLVLQRAKRKKVQRTPKKTKSR